MNKPSNLALVYRPMRLNCPWVATAEHEIMLNTLAELVGGKQGMSSQKAWELYAIHRVGLIAHIAIFGRVWVVRDCPKFGDETLNVEIISLSAN